MTLRSRASGGFGRLAPRAGSRRDALQGWRRRERVQAAHAHLTYSSDKIHVSESTVTSGTLRKKFWKRSCGEAGGNRSVIKELLGGLLRVSLWLH